MLRPYKTIKLRGVIPSGVCEARNLSSLHPLSAPAPPPDKAINHPIVIPSAARDLLFPYCRSPANSPLPNIPRPSPQSSRANLLPSISPLKSGSSTASSPSLPRAQSNPRTTFPTAASPSPLPNPASPPASTHCHPDPQAALLRVLRRRDLLFPLSAQP